MSYSIIATQRFENELKRLAKKFPSLKNEFSDLISNIIEDPEIGAFIGNNCYKIRLGIGSKGKGKSGGARIITYVVTPQKEIYLLTIFDKAEFDSIDDKTLRRIIAVIPTEK